MNHEPNTLALLISLICAGASADALGKAAETATATATATTTTTTNDCATRYTSCTSNHASEKNSLSQAACVVQRKLATPNAWPLILNGIRDAEAGSLGLSLSVATHHDVPPSWREPDAPGVDSAVETASLVAGAGAVAVELEPEDPLERANAAAKVANGLLQSAASPQAATVLPRSHPAQPATPTKTGVESATPVERSQTLALPNKPLASQREEIAVTASAQRVMRDMRDMRDLAAMRFAALAIDPDEAVAPASALKDAVAVTPTSPLTALTPSATVLANLSDVLMAPGVTQPTTRTFEDADDGSSLKAEIAARQEVKRMKRRARAEEAAFAKAARADHDGHADQTEQAEQAGHAVHAGHAVQAEQTEQAVRTNPFGGQRVAVLDNALDRVRGGFVTPSLNIAFGIERAVYINGSLVTTTSLNISDLGHVTTNTSANANSASGADSKQVSPGTLALIQSGAGNSVAGGAFSTGAAAGLSANAIGTVVQNTLDGQKIQNVTVINATANSLGVLRGLNLQNALRSSLIDSLRR